jgi:adenosylmethionine-8-amino-7-oxononanoate aminotransferase
MLRRRTWYRYDRLGREIVSDREKKTPFSAEAGMSPRIAHCLIDEGVFLRVWDVIRLAPPLIATMARLDRPVSRQGGRTGWRRG